ncbi:MAG: hypothetical protein J7M10_07555 [Candidatus Cloacimonetes bacterium]|nr:hypothetical protein [Candidatus Cloacimonadota bacterium]
MKKIFFIMILLCVMAYAHADENTITSNSTTQINKKIEIKYRKNFLYLRLTPLLIPGCAVGFTHRIRLIDETIIDFTLAAHYHFYRELHKSYGASIISEHFGNTRAIGLFFRANVGAEYAEMQNPLDDDPKPEKRWMPNITMGLGYSFMIFNNSYLRLSAEIGYTMLLGRINCEFLF